MYYKIILVFFLPLFLYAQESKTLKRLAYVNSMNTNLKYKNSKDSLEIWVKHITNNITDTLSFETYTDNYLMLNDYFNKNIDIVAINPIDYMKNINKFNKVTNEYWHMKKERDLGFHKKYLIVNRKSNVNSLKDLENKKIVINNANKSAKLFLEKKFLEKYKKSAKKILGNTEYIRSNSILLNVFFKKYDAAVINSNEYDTMMELNPSISKKIKILEESPRIFNFMFIAFSKNLNNDDMKNYHKILYDFLSDKNKNELFNLLKIKSIETEADNIKDLAKYYKEYLKLKKRYDK